MKRGQVEAYKRLVVDGIELVPVDYSVACIHKLLGNAPVDSVTASHVLHHNGWHIPGGSIMTTDQIVARAKKHGLAVKLEEHSSEGITRTTLN